MKRWRELVAYRRAKRQVKSIRYDLIIDDPRMAEYRRGGEWAALIWLKAFVERPAAVATPRELVESTLRAIARGDDPKFNAQYAETLLPYIA